MSDPHDPDDGASNPAGATGPAEDIGSVGEEAAKLFGALSGWARESTGLDEGLRGGIGESLSGLAEHAAATVSDINEHLATGSAECTYCPLCRTVHVLRQTSPEVKAHLAGAASSFLQAMVGVLATLPPPSSSQSAQPSGAGVERIDLDDPDAPDHEDDLT